MWPCKKNTKLKKNNGCVVEEFPVSFVYSLNYISDVEKCTIAFVLLFK